MNDVRQYRKRPVVVEAVQWAGDNADVLRRFAVDDFRVGRPDPTSDYTARIWDHLHDQWIRLRNAVPARWHMSRKVAAVDLAQQMSRFVLLQRAGRATNADVLAVAEAHERYRRSRT